MSGSSGTVPEPRPRAPCHGRGCGYDTEGGSGGMRSSDVVFGEGSWGYPPPWRNATHHCVNGVLPVGQTIVIFKVIWEGGKIQRISYKNWTELRQQWAPPFNSKF